MYKMIHQTPSLIKLVSPPAWLFRPGFAINHEQYVEATMIKGTYNPRNFVSFKWNLCFDWFVKQVSLGAYTFLLFATVLFASAIFSYFFLPETNNTSFEETTQYFRRISLGAAGMPAGIPVPQGAWKSAPEDEKVPMDQMV